MNPLKIEITADHGRLCEFFAIEEHRVLGTQGVCGLSGYGHPDWRELWLRILVSQLFTLRSSQSSIIVLYIQRGCLCLARLPIISYIFFKYQTQASDLKALLETEVGVAVIRQF